MAWKAFEGAALSLGFSDYSAILLVIDNAENAKDRAAEMTAFIDAFKALAKRRRVRPWKDGER